MSQPSTHHILIADHKTRRAQAIADTLERGWRAGVWIASTSEEARDASREAADDGQHFTVVMVAFGLDHLSLLKTLCARPATAGYLIVDDDRIPRPSNVPVSGILLLPESIVADDAGLIAQLLAAIGDRWHEPPQMSNAGTLPMDLRFLVESLDPDGQFTGGTTILREIVGQILPGAPSFELDSLGQGLSGAKVFRVSCSNPDDDSAQCERVLKLTATTREHAYKGDHELRSYREIKKALADAAVSMIPKMYGAGKDADGNAQPALSGGWSAVMYAFLGGEALAITDLERAFLDPDRFAPHDAEVAAYQLKGLGPMGLPGFFLDKLLIELGKWYTVSSQVANQPLWSEDDAPNYGPPTFPPYRLKRWEKGRIHATLHLLDGYGSSIGADWWRDAQHAVLSCLTVDQAFPEELGCLVWPTDVVLSPVHGDLNANNALLTLRHGIPLLIDFAGYQSRGHTLQDFARLEVAIKLELMGREARDGPAGLDLNCNQMPFWCAAEDWLSAWPDDVSELATAARHRYLERAYQLCWHVRQRARQIQDQLMSGADTAGFRCAYNAALLYHTLRAVRYDRLSHLKRLFAVYCAGRIIEQTRQGALTTYAK